MSYKNCIFCQMMANKANAAIVYEDTSCIVILDLFPIKTGHALVIPKQHTVLLNEIEQEQRAHLMAIVSRVIEAQKKSELKSRAANVLLNDGKAAGQHVAHVHFHVIPRRGGVFDSLFISHIMRFISLIGFMFNKQAHNKKLQRIAENLKQYI